MNSPLLEEGVAVAGVVAMSGHHIGGMLLATSKIVSGLSTWFSAGKKHDIRSAWSREFGRDGPQEYSENDLAEGKHIEEAFKGTRVLEHDGNFVESVVKRSRQIARRHVVLILGHQGVGKSELCNAIRKFATPLALSGAVSATTNMACSYPLRDPLALSVDGDTTHLSVELVDTIGWSSKQPSSSWIFKRSKNSLENYQGALKHVGLDDRHLPHIVLFVMSAKSMREVTDDAANMQQAFSGFNSRTLVPVTVIPVLTHRDCCKKEDHKSIRTAARHVANIAFKGTKATVKDPVHFVASVTAQSPQPQVEDGYGAGEDPELEALRKHIYGVVDEQVKDKNFRAFFLQTMVEDTIAACRSFHERYPDVESEWALFKAAARAVAAAYGCGSNGPVDSQVRPPWDLLEEPSLKGAQPSWSQTVGIVRTRLRTALQTHFVVLLAMVVVLVLVLVLVDAAIYFRDSYLVAQQKTWMAKQTIHDMNATIASLDGQLTACAKKNDATAQQTVVDMHAELAREKWSVVGVFCNDYLRQEGCAWTLQYNCPGQDTPGSQGPAGEPTGVGYKCCCTMEHWKFVTAI
mmetsp:Transcript_23695/g.80144  ORF Transcript_23695/g.80144 Transcript_23695/m.80144 type:complete len:575 (+) Transcript_23695:120-1844(+)|eukprot:CAMPEP_0203863106 /NCGR_PEP_ID=MMETSP0359-20131031/13976_1 /ASSEMBLY_ACC=CAM_ASM_000338 /TAXON_ID=268821 /ORGANISM="Scrippsiella Hangoei, Strain SHTV-5" /LENGTH=574 /DNA_ID=CAMNT_0050780601 /DNA_START=69 /DNA_END=1793 /DNA_ORIENTATION=+